MQEEILNHTVIIKQKLNKSRLLLYDIFVEFSREEDINEEYVLSMLKRLGSIVYFNEKTNTISFRNNGGYTCSLFVVYRDYIKDISKLMDLIKKNEIVL